MNRLNLRIVPIDWHPRYSYAIAGLQVNGKRKRLYFKDARAAAAELERLKIKARRQGEAGLNISDNLRDMAVDCAKRLRPHGKTIADATAFYLHHLAAEESAQVGALVDDYLRTRQRAQLSARHFNDISSRLSRFKEDFGERPVRTVGAQEVEDWLFSARSNGDALSAQTVANRRALLHAFFTWLLRQKKIEYNPIAAIAKPRVVRGAPEIWAPGDLEKLLQAAAPFELLPILAIGAFAGLRTSELLGLDWSEVALERGFIEVKGSKAKSARRRLVKIEPNLAQWLEPYAGCLGGQIWPKGWRSYHEAAAKLCRELGLEWPENGLRHSYTSYSLMQHQSAEALSLALGHTSSRMIFEHYRELTTPEQAARYWAIRPRDSAV
jgi:integrase